MVTAVNPSMFPPSQTRYLDTAMEAKALSAIQSAAIKGAGWDLRCGWYMIDTAMKKNMIADKDSTMSSVGFQY